MSDSDTNPGLFPYDPNNIEAIVESLLRILDAIDSQSIHQEISRARIPATGRAFLTGDKYQDWQKSKGGVLWGTGRPGVGKTYHTSAIIDELQGLQKQNSGVALAFHYIRYCDLPSIKTVVAGILSRVIERCMDPSVAKGSSVVKAAEGMLARCQREKGQPTLVDLTAVLRDVLSLFTERYVALDGLDELPEESQLEVIELVASLDANIFLSSRPLKPLELRLEELRTSSKPVLVDIVAQDDVLEKFIHRSIDRTPEVFAMIRSPDIRVAMAAKFKEKCNGLFLVVSYLLETLRHCLNLAEVWEEVELLPTEVEPFYAVLVETIQAQNSKHFILVMRILLWHVYPRRSLYPEELQNALAMDIEAQKVERDRIIHPEILVNLCGGLIVLDKATNRFRLTHYTAQEGLRRLLPKYLPPPEETVLTTCIARLVECDFPRSQFEERTQLEKAFGDSPFLRYAHENLGYHIRQTAAENGPRALDIALQFVRQCESFPFWYPFGLSGDDNSRLCNLNSLHTAIFLDNPTLFEELITKDTFNVNSPAGKSGVTALMLAAAHGHVSIVERLLALPGVEVNVVADGMTTLGEAAACGHKAIVKLLLAVPGININLIDKYGHSPLMGSASFGHESIVKLLLSLPGIDLNLGDNEGWSALMMAARYGYDGVVKILLDVPGIDFNQVDTQGWSSLMVAANEGHISVVRLLLAVPGIAVNLVDDEGLSALMMSSGTGYGDIVKLLLDFPGIEVNLVDKEGWTALILASKDGKIDIVQSILNYPGVQVHLANNKGQTARDLAETEGYENVASVIDSYARAAE